MEKSNFADSLKAIFVCSFDTRLGNVLEWQYPREVNLDKIEFKALASCLHLTQYDLVYFNHNGMFGLAAFKTLVINDSKERNVRMKSVGLISKSYESLKEFYNFLAHQVKVQLDNPGVYVHLESFWSNKIINENEFLILKYNKLDIISNEQSKNLLSLLFDKRLRLFKDLDVRTEFNEKIYLKCALFYGPSLFIIWKYLLLNKRIMIYSQPPVINLCLRLMCLFEMLKCDVFDFKLFDPKPYFYVSVVDIDQLSEESSYIACTTEKIFESKQNLFDLYIDNSEILCVNSNNRKQSLKPNSLDKKRSDTLIDLLMNSNEQDQQVFLKFEFKNIQSIRRNTINAKSK
ncbi:unnamed protein product [Brachionus calyciflorus]|uniref:UDENN domain-containing protein n=1 Tax=Brachionus calyciflorus TaxID=104777 RepID=A0A814GF21_9BILA|nr:unnamed protein product [Brachionus calyciflorus]